MRTLVACDDVHGEEGGERGADTVGGLRSRVSSEEETSEEEVREERP